MASDDDDFDWAAAVAEIDRACSRPSASVDVRGESQGSQSRAFHQKTLDCFVRGPPKQCPNTNASQPRVSERLLYPHLGDQGSTFPDFWAHNIIDADQDDACNGEGRLPLDREAAQIWIYPANVPHRVYQFDIAKSALFCNTLVCLPTGLGKTLIAAVVMYNYFLWFPTGKIVFAAPSRPLVVQQIEACHMVTGIPQSMTIDMTGQMNPQTRGEYWQSKRVFFVTPQVLEKDIKSGRCATKQIICLVLDEAHRATGNYAYCVIVRELLAANVEPRILALTATPGSQQSTIQAVVDNLRISCMEYRNENDPDVRQYTHHRKIELIEVALNAECTRVKDVFIEVVQPIVQRLCYLGVFYNRDISKLTPYEFLSARDKFRQAPPPSLQQSRYSEVENYFGLAITLFHVFKLLITHGMRPAFEMLRQKVEQGVLKKLARNEKLCQVQDLMKQSIGHGAPNPKLEKVAEIINNHFSVHDAHDTRVIIFTNFRESVRDIMEKLGAACACVKAMEFIGQSSGKFSKGQSQKTQQAVLQKFRGGCYNTIVATSIAEEGLDIMEVDLVVCFDANISPLRMIQRMGRTGRKRDGRVVVLASGGSEMQGYLRKQAKSKVLSKHMVNGGLQSFNFHPSHHMIPHSLQTKVQFKELSIEDFIPRSRKLKDKHAKEGNGNRRNLSERELETLKLIKELPGVEPKVPSRAADPENPVFAGPVGCIKHSRRSCLLMDVLQTLRMRCRLDKEEQLSHEKVCSLAPVEVPMRRSNPTSSSSTKSSPSKDPAESLISLSHVEDEGRHGDYLERPPTIPETQKDSRSAEELPDNRTKIIADGELLQTPPYLFSDRPDLTYFEILDDQQAIGVHSCRFRNGSVSVSEFNLIRIGSPPPLNFSMEDKLEFLDSSYQHRNLSIDLKTPGQNIRSLNTTRDGTDFASVCERQSVFESSCRAADDSSYDVAGANLTTSALHESNTCCSAEKSREQKSTHLSSEEPKALSDELCRGKLVPPEHKPAYVSCGIERSCMRPPTFQSEPAPIENQNDTSQSRPPKRPKGLEENLSETSLPVTSVKGFPEALKTNVPGCIWPVGPRGPLEGGRQALDRVRLVETTFQCHENCKVSNDDKISQHGKGFASNRNRSPLQIFNTAGSKEDWEGQDTEPLGSIPKQRKLKRLLRGCEKRPVCFPREGVEKGQTSISQGAVPVKVHRSISNREKSRRKVAARIFIDEEAGVSSDEENDDSSGNGGGDDENGESLDSFIDTTATQHLNGSVEMMSIYRRSLLTPSPSDSLMAMGMGLRHQCTPPDVTPSSRGSSPASATLAASLNSKMLGSRSSSHSDPPSESTPHTLVHSTLVGDFTVPMTSYGTSQSENGSKKPFDDTDKELEDQKRPEYRKRKLQFESSSADDDDLFRGVDLDALEAEAAAISRSRADGQNIQDVQKQNRQIWETSGQKSSTFLGGPSSQAEKENEFQFFPSFDLGLDR